MRDRLGHVDDLKVVLTAGVIAAHAAITYGAEGSWYYTEDGPEWLTVPLALGAIFGMGLFFFLAGAFTPASAARKGVRRFLADRWQRLGIPFAAFVLLVQPAVQWWVDGGPAPEVWEGQLRDLDAGPLWFVGVLLLCSTAAAPFLRRGAAGRAARANAGADRGGGLRRELCVCAAVRSCVASRGRTDPVTAPASR